jgi:uncharacterized membrane protein
MDTTSDSHLAVVQEEDRILRFWTPILLRTILLVSVVILVFGLVTMTTRPDLYVTRYRAAQGAHFITNRTFARQFSFAMQGDPHAIMTFGLYALTLVPLARVAFCFLLFIKERDYAYVGFTAYVLIGLILGMLLGRMG